MRLKMNQFLTSNGLPPLIGTTPSLFGKGRSVEVLTWLDTFTDGGSPKGTKVHGWVFVDEVDALDRDGVDTINNPAPREAAVADRFVNHFVRVHLRKGITPEIADKAIECIRGKPLRRAAVEAADDSSSSNSGSDSDSDDDDAGSEQSTVITTTTTSGSSYVKSKWR